MRTPCTAALLLCLSVASVACESNDPEKCPSGDRTMQPTPDFAELGYPDGAVACVTGGLGTPIVFYNGIESDEAAAVKLASFMKSKGYEGMPQAATKSDLEAAEKGKTRTRLLFVKSGASVRYYVTLSPTTRKKAVAVGWTRVDCAATPNRYECKL